MILLEKKTEEEYSKIRIFIKNKIGDYDMLCKQCNSQMTCDKENKLFTCPSCGNTEPFDDAKTDNDKIKKVYNTKKEEDNSKKEESNSKKKEGNSQKKEGNSKKKKDHSAIIEKEPINWKKEIISWGIIIAVAFGLAFLITQFVIMKAEIVSGSMMPRLQKDDHVIGNRLAYLFSDPQRGDVIFFEYPLSYKSKYEIDPELTYCRDYELGDKEKKYHTNSEVYVKRIIGLPGDKVEIKKGKVYINDSDTPLEEPYLNGTPKKMNFGPYYVPEDCYFCLGDNRNNSLDSRYWDNPIDPETNPDRFRFVHKSAIYAKAALKLPPDMHWIEHYRYEQDKEKTE